MTLAGIQHADVDADRHVKDVLEYRAPFLIEKLLREHIIDTPEEGEALFTELKRYMILFRSDDTKIYEMYSLRIDEVWHQFILFTREYTDFCKRFFGRYFQHSPSNSPRSETGSRAKVTSFENFKSQYEEFFSAPLPDEWYDEKSITIHRRVLNDHAGTLTILDDGEMVHLVTPTGEILFSVNQLARSALSFIAQAGAFYVRELPGGLDGEEKTALVAALVECHVLRVRA